MALSDLLQAQRHEKGGNDFYCAAPTAGRIALVFCAACRDLSPANVLL
jgi:hypothetical protein